VPEYDAFGREIGEDTLAPWRQGSTALPPQPAADEPRRQAAAPAAVTAGDPLGAATAPPAAPPPRPRAHAPAAGFRPPRRRRRRGVRFVILLAILWGGFNLVGTLADKVEDASREITIPGLRPPTPADEPTGLAAGSLLRPTAFQRAMADFRRRDIGRIQSLRVAPERINASLLTPKGTLVSVQVSSGGEFQRFSESGAGFGGLETIPYRRLDPRVPQRLTRAAAERLGKPVSQINYLVPSLTQGEITWGAYFKSGEIFIADARGRIIRRIS
jgi:hypothetical protein